MKRLPIVLAALLFSACGVPEPPAIRLTSTHGDQQAVPGSSCLSKTIPLIGSGQGSCVDTGPISPTEVTGVRRGDIVEVLFVDAKVVRSELCHEDVEQDCIGFVVVSPLGCADRRLEQVPLALGPETPWTVDLEPGAYQLDVNANIETRSGATGGVTGTFGLVVIDETGADRIGVHAALPTTQACPSG